MSRKSTTFPIGSSVIVFAAAIGLCIDLYYFFAPLTGVRGTLGAVLVVVSSLLLILDGIVLWMIRRGWAYWLFWVLGVLGTIGTLTAGWFLHEWLLMAAMAVVLVGFIVSIFRR